MNAMLKYFIAFALLLLLGAGTSTATEFRFGLLDNSTVQTYAAEIRMRQALQVNGTPYPGAITQVWTTAECTAIGSNGQPQALPGSGPPAGQSVVVIHPPSGVATYFVAQGAMTLWDPTCNGGNGCVHPKINILSGSGNSVTCTGTGPSTNTTTWAIDMGDMSFTAAEVRPTTVGYASAVNAFAFQTSVNNGATPNCLLVPTGGIAQARLAAPPMATIVPGLAQYSTSVPEVMVAQAVGSTMVYAVQTNGAFRCDNIGVFVETPLFASGFE